jgi:hypothetical protein
MKEKLKRLGRVLSKAEQKEVLGGLVGGGACYIVYSDQGYSSCWYCTGSEIDLCERVYPGHCKNVSIAVDCQSNNCTMS